MVRPRRLLEIGAGYTTPFLLQALINAEIVLNDGNLNWNYINKSTYDPRLIIVDDMSLGKLKENPFMAPIIDSDYVEFVEGVFQGKAEGLRKAHGNFDFVWFDCGGPPDYEAFFDEYWSICSSYIICHFTYSNGSPNANFKAISRFLSDDVERLDIIEPHKTRQGSVTILKKKHGI